VPKEAKAAFTASFANSPSWDSESFTRAFGSFSITLSEDFLTLEQRKFLKFFVPPRQRFFFVSSWSNEAKMSDEEWDTDPDFVNDVSEKQQRWGNKGLCIFLFRLAPVCCFRVYIGYTPQLYVYPKPTLGFVCPKTVDRDRQDGRHEGCSRGG